MIAVQLEMLPSPSSFFHSSDPKTPSRSAVIIRGPTQPAETVLGDLDFATASFWTRPRDDRSVQYGAPPWEEVPGG